MTPRTYDVLIFLPPYDEQPRRVYTPMSNSLLRTLSLWPRNGMLWRHSGHRCIAAERIARLEFNNRSTVNRGNRISGQCVFPHYTARQAINLLIGVGSCSYHPSVISTWPEPRMCVLLRGSAPSYEHDPKSCNVPFCSIYLISHTVIR